MCPLCPGQSRDHFAMNVAIMLLRWASTFMKVLNSAALSAEASAPSNAMAASITPGPVSSCRPSMPKSIASHVASSWR